LGIKNKPKYHSAWNNIGKRECSEIKPRRLDFSQAENLTMPKHIEFKKLLKFSPLDLLKPIESLKRVKNSPPQELEENNVTPVKLKFGKGMLNFSSTGKRMSENTPKS
jgi:hypothetical protein